jgi:hypothetical protein
VNNYVYGQTDGSRVDEEGNPAADGEFMMRNWKQAKAHLYGVEGEWTYNHSGEGWSGRVFGDLSRGYLDNAGNLPLQPAVRTGFDIGYRQGVWRTTLRTLHAMKQDRLASFENFVTPSYQSGSGYYVDSVTAIRAADLVPDREKYSESGYSPVHIDSARNRTATRSPSGSRRARQLLIQAPPCYEL